MGRPYGDDLRRKFLLAYDAGECSLEHLASRFFVSVGWAKKISAQRKRTGQCERVPHKPGRKPQAGVEAQKQVVAWVGEQPDLTLAQLQAKLDSEAEVVLSRGRVWYLVRKLGLRLKKSRSTLRNATQKPTSSGVKSSSLRSVRSRRNG
jgi:transposase